MVIHVTYKLEANRTCMSIQKKINLLIKTAENVINIDVLTNFRHVLELDNMFYSKFHVMVIHVTYELKANTTCTYDIESEDHAIIITFNATGERFFKLAPDQTASSQ